METPNTDSTERQNGDPWDHPDIIASIDEMISDHYRKEKRTPVSRIPALGSPLHTSISRDTPLKPFSEIDPLKPFAYNRSCGNLHKTCFPSSRPHPNTTLKKPQRVWKPKKTHPKLVLGMDVGLSEACNLALCALVGRLAYKDKCNLRLDDWITDSWKPLLGYLPKVLYLQHGWIGFIFKMPEDSIRVLEKF
jgi:hypothetical protein